VNDHRFDGQSRLSKQGALGLIEQGDLVGLREYLWLTCEFQDSGCVVWAGSLSNGYPHDSKHRRVYEIAHGAIPIGFHVHHKCSNRACLNPRHLSAEPADRNAAEMLERKAYRDRIEHLERCLEEAGLAAA